MKAPTSSLYLRLSQLAAVRTPKPPQPEAIHLWSSSRGLGDSICSIYAACGLASVSEKPVVYHCRHHDWLGRISHPNLTIVKHSTSGHDIGGGWQAYRQQIFSAQSRCKKYVLDMAEKLALTPFPALRPQTIDRSTQRKDKYIVLAPFSCHPVRQWPLKNWTLLAKELCASGYKLICIGGAEHAVSMTALFSEQVECVQYEAGKHPDTILDIVAGASLLIGIDSGPAHLGGLLGVPTIAIHAGSLPHQFLFDMAPNVSSVVGSPSLPRSDHNPQALGSVTVEAVMEAVGKRLAEQPPSRVEATPTPKKDCGCGGKRMELFLKKAATAATLII